MDFEFEISATPNSLKVPGEKGFALWVLFNMPPESRRVVEADKELDFAEGPFKLIPTFRFPLFKKQMIRPWYKRFWIRNFFDRHCEPCEAWCGKRPIVSAHSRCFYRVKSQ